MVVKDIAWAAGFLEGEGSFCCTHNNGGKNAALVISAGQTIKEPLERLQRIFGGRINPRKKLSGTLGKKPQWVWAISGIRAERAMLDMYNLLSERRQKQIDKALGVWHTRRNPRDFVKSRIYLVGSLINPRVPEVAIILREKGWDVFDWWHAPGPETDDYWQKHERAKGLTYSEALDGDHARNVFDVDKMTLDSSQAVVFVYPAGKSAAIELGYAVGCGKKTAVLLETEPDRYDVMFQLADKVCHSVEELHEWLKKQLGKAFSQKSTD